MYVLRALDYKLDREHFRTAYSWRTAKRLERGGVISFDEFASAKPDEISWGLFNEELLAVYLLQQRSATSFQVHFATKKGADKQVLIAGARKLRDVMFQNGALELFGYLLPEHARPNHPLRQFATAVGFSYCGEMAHAGKMHDREVIMLKFSVRR